MHKYSSLLSERSIELIDLNNETNIDVTEGIPTGTVLELKYLLLFSQVLCDIVTCLV